MSRIKKKNLNNKIEVELSGQRERERVGERDRDREYMNELKLYSVI